MGGKNKHKKRGGGHSSPPSRSTNITEDDMCNFVVEATEMQVMLNQRHEKLRQMKEFAYLLSTKWLREWKDYVGYDALFGDDKAKNNKTGKKKPGPPNTDLQGSRKGYLEVPEQLSDEYGFLNVVIKQKMEVGEDFIAVTDQIWNQFNSVYGPGLEIKRPLRITKSKSAVVDEKLMKCDFIFINYNEEGFLDRLHKAGKNGYAALIPDFQVQFSELWNLQDLYAFMRKLCLVKYNSDQIKLWLYENFHGMLSIQENFVKAVKAKNYELFAVQMKEEDHPDLDLDQFIKTNYVIIVEIGDSRIVPIEVTDDIHGYCEECVEKKELRYHCDCAHKHYCSRQCQVDDQVFHFKSCKLAFNDPEDDKYKKTKAKNVESTSRCGLKNLGNTCYMNSSIQTFLNLDFLVNFLTANEFVGKVSKKEEDGLLFLHKVSKTLKKMGQQSEMGYIEPWDLKGQVNFFLPPFKGYKQHDAIDFLMGFVNTINQCLEKEEGEAYHPLMKENMIGEFDSLVICPKCTNQVKNAEIYTQLTLPIKSKTLKTLYKYAIFHSPLSYQTGKAEVKATWQSLRSDIGVTDECLILGGAENEAGFTEVNFGIGPEGVLKKFKKQLLCYPYLTVSEEQFIIPAIFITTKLIAGNELKANAGYPFPLVVDRTKTMGHFFIQALRALHMNKEQQVLGGIQAKYLNIKQFMEETMSTSQTKTQISQKKGAGKKQQLKDEDRQILEASQNQLRQLNQQMNTFLAELELTIFIEDTKKIKNICFFCKGKCTGCPLRPDFAASQDEVLGLKENQAKLSIKVNPKPEQSSVKKDLASSGDGTLQQCLALFAEPEELDEENAWYCPVCQDMQLALKQLHVSRFPRCLIIQLGRFKNGANGRIKNNEPISYGEFELFGEHTYRLSAVIVHEGSIEGGHYWSICRRGDDFFIFNDEKVVKTDKFCNKNAYILCYNRLEQAK